MKKQILAFEQVEGRSLDLRRLYNARALNLLGGKKMGQGLEKCVYDSNRHLECNHKSIPKLDSNQVNVVLSADAYEEEQEAKQKIVHALDPSVVDQIFITLDDQPVCRNLKLPPRCTSEARKADKIVLVRSEKGSTSKKFKTREEFGTAILNLVFALWALHAHGLVHGDVKIAPGANNVVRAGKVYKLIDLGMVMTFDHFRKGMEEKSSDEAKELWSMRKYVFWSIGHLYALLHKQDVQETCRRHNIPWQKVLRLFFENIDLAGFMRSLRILVHLNPSLKLKPLYESLYAQTNDFQDVDTLNAYKVVWSCTKAVSSSMDVGDRGKVNESFVDLSTMYKRIRAYCNLTNLPETIELYHK